VGLGALVYLSWSLRVLDLSVGKIVLALGTVVATALGFGWVSRVVRYRKTGEQILIGIALFSVGAFLARLHLHVFDRWFLRQGTVERLLRAQRQAA